MKLTTHLNIVPRLRITEVKPPYPHKSSQRSQGQIYLPTFENEKYEALMDEDAVLGGMVTICRIFNVCNTRDVPLH
jgi:hypothetical protein